MKYFLPEKIGGATNKLFVEVLLILERISGLCFLFLLFGGWKQNIVQD